MADERAHLAQADRHNAGAKQHIRKQERLVERLAAKGYPVENAENFLSALVALNTLERHRLLILDRLQA
jgi:hypothetical protein